MGGGGFFDKKMQKIAKIKFVPNILSKIVDLSVYYLLLEWVEINGKIILLYTNNFEIEQWIHFRRYTVELPAL